MSDTHKLWLNYGDWLVKLVGFERKGYDNLMELMHMTPFTYTVERDRNRASDGQYLRGQYFDEVRVGYAGQFDRYDASVLEVLVALAIRLDNEYIGDPGEGHPEEIFWEMLENLGFDTPKARNAHFRMHYCYEILVYWMERRYDRRGTGGVFPMRKTRRNQKKLELWDQAMEYVSENYV